MFNLFSFTRFLDKSIIMIVFAFTFILTVEKVHAAPTNLALNKKATQSSTLGNGHAKRAVDGNKLDWNNNQTKKEREPFWQVDLGAVKKIDYINVFNRNSKPNDYSERLSNFYVFVSDTPIKGRTIEQVLMLQPDIIKEYYSSKVEFPSKLKINNSGRYVRIQLKATQHLHMTEVEVIEQDDAPVVLLSKGKKATQSATRGNGHAKRAVDGNKLDWNNNQTEKHREPWWQVDLGAVYDLDHVNIFNRNSTPNNYADRLQKYYILVSDKPIKGNNLTKLLKDDGITSYYQSEAAKFPSKIQLNKAGRYVRVQLTESNLLHMTEVEVYGLKDVVSTTVATVTTQPTVTKAPAVVVSKPTVAVTPAVTTQPVINTSAATTVAKGWPKSGTNGNLAYGGVFIGNYGAGTYTGGNSQLSNYTAQRFLAQKTGNLEKFRYQNRVLTMKNIEDRCDPANSISANGRGNIYCSCLTAKLNANQCAYLLGNSYHVGNGGCISAELRTDKNGEPGDLLGKTEEFSPAKEGNKTQKVLTFSKKVPVKEGQLYWVEWSNSCPTTCRAGTTAQAKNCNPNTGRISINGDAYSVIPKTHGNDGVTAGEFGPWKGNSSKQLRRNNKNEAWTENFNGSKFNRHLGWFEIGYDDGIWTGNSTVATQFLANDSGKIVMKDHMVVRQTWKQQSVDQTVDGLWLMVGHDVKGARGQPGDDGPRPDGSSVKAVLKDSKNNVLATALVPHSEYCADASRERVNVGVKQQEKQKFCREWKYADFSSEVTLKKDQTYHVDYTASASSNAIISTQFEYGYGGWQSINAWDQAQAFLSKNGGRQFNVLPGPAYQSRRRDVVMLMTIKGMPKSMP